MSYQIEGLIHKVFPSEQKSETITSRDFVILVPGQFPQHIKFQLLNDKCVLADNIPEGSSVKVHFDIRGREWQGKYFTNLSAWQIDVLQKAAANPSNGIEDATVEEVQPF